MGYNSARTAINVAAIMAGTLLVPAMADAHGHQHQTTKHTEHIRHTVRAHGGQAVVHHARGTHGSHHLYRVGVRMRSHGHHHGAWAPRAKGIHHQVDNELWTQQTVHAPTWVLPPVCDRVLTYTGACQPAVLEALRVLGQPTPVVEDRERMATHLQSILDHSGLHQVETACQSLLAQDQQKIAGLQLLLTQAHVAASDDCASEVRKLAGDETVASAASAVAGAQLQDRPILDSKADSQ
ncbi:hypothetical protein [Paraburkholderia sp. J8-2]|uniref:hypothetical protein n=1 Tax=Paraburkholderia sp. J8-2 TaxID=2805440 RepID=UPI002AB61C01|nr:hypothetical protein [Paraburkholderia sp. J8-2]